MKAAKTTKVLGSVLLFLTSVSMAVGADRPNILIILLDDAGWTDLGVYGSRIATPQMDGLAARGMRFTDAHSAAPNCSPARAGLLTGRIPPRTGIYGHLPGGHVMHLPPEEVTLAELLKPKGYHTGHFGKWHLSIPEWDHPQPRDQGFDRAVYTENNADPSHLNPINFYRDGKAMGEIEGYSCQFVVDQTVSWLDEIEASPTSDPFFTCVWFHEPHYPIASPPDLVRHYQEQFPELSEDEAAYCANIANVDLAVGRLLKKLDQLGVTENTLIFLTSDNGPVIPGPSAIGLRGRKSNLWEGGHRVPGIFTWPERIEPGSISHEPISGIDLLPTVCELLEIPTPAGKHIDGTSILPLLEGQSETLVRHQPLYWFFYRLNPAVAVREGKWSLLSFTNDSDRPKTHRLIRDDMPHIKNSTLEEFLLFDLESDLAQQQDVSAQYPEVLDRLSREAIEIHQSVLAEGPTWDIPADHGAGNARCIWE